MRKNTNLFLVALVFFHLGLLSLTQFTVWPEILSYPYLVSRGYTLYSDFVHPYPPLLTLVLVPLYQLFGYTPLVARIFAYALVIVSDVLVYKITLSVTRRQIYSTLAVFIYAVLHVSLDGNMIWFDTVIVSSSLAVLYFVLQSRYRMAGLFLALSVATKQTAGLMGLVVVEYLFWQSKNKGKDLIQFLSAPALIGILLSLILVVWGVFDDMFMWVIKLPFTHWSAFPGYVELHLLRRDWWILGSLGAPLLLLAKRKKETPLLLGFFVAALVMVYPRFSYFHLQLAIAVLPICYATIFAQKRLKWLYVYLAAVLLFVAKPTLMRLGQYEMRFATSKEYALGSDIHSLMSNHSGTVFLLGIDSSQYVYANVLPPKPWVDNYGWYFEMPTVMETTLMRWEENPPVVVLRRPPFDGAWYALGTYEPKPLLAWLESHYVKTGHLSGTIEVWERKN